MKTLDDNMRQFYEIKNSFHGMESVKHTILERIHDVDVDMKEKLGGCLRD